MMNVFFPDEGISENDVYFVCYMLECISRKIKQPKSYIVNKMTYEELAKKISLANVLHAENPEKVVYDWIEEYELVNGSYDVCKVDHELVETIPTSLQMGKVYRRLILSTLEENEDYVQAMIRIYNDPICEIIDDYNCSAYYEPSYFITQAYYRGSFN